MIDKCRDSGAIDYQLAVSQPEKIGFRLAVVERVRLLHRDPRPGVFDDPGFSADRAFGIATVHMYFRGANDEVHGFELIRVADPR